jgi:hypothetical protein
MLRLRELIHSGRGLEQFSGAGVLIIHAKQGLECLASHYRTDNRIKDDSKSW